MFIYVVGYLYLFRLYFFFYEVDVGEFVLFVFGWYEDVEVVVYFVIESEWGDIVGVGVIGFVNFYSCGCKSKFC